LKTIDFIVLNWKSEQSTLACIASINQLSGDYQKRIIVVDNEGTPESHQALTEGAETELTIVTNRRNLGFSGGVNSALPYLESSFVGLVNNDCLLDKGWLTAGLDRLDDHSVGLVGGREYAWDSENPPYKTTNRYTLLPVVSPIDATVHHVIDAKENRNDLPFITASNVLVRGDLFKKLNGFDRRFFAYYEDVDLCARIIDQGYTIGFTPHMMAWHEGNGTSKRIPYAKVYYSRRNPCLVIAKHFKDHWLRTVASHALSEMRNGGSLWLRKHSEEDKLIARAGIAAGLWTMVNLPGLAYNRRLYLRSLKGRPTAYYGLLRQFYATHQELTQPGA